MRRRLAVIVLSCLAVTLALADAAGWTSQRGLFTVSYSSELEPIRINQLHTWVLHLENSRGEPVTDALIGVEGGMPAHDHGLPTQPRVTAELGSGDYRLDGLRFHMRGDWELKLNIEADGKSDTVVVKLSL